MKQITKSIGHAWNGLRHVFKTERNFRVHTVIALIISCVAYSLGWEPWKWSVLFVVFTMIMSLEAVNSAIEYTWNHLEPAHHPVVGLIKDVMAGAVLIASIGAVIIGGILFLS